jgi:DNA-binding NtrC family response regulator
VALVQAGERRCPVKATIIQFRATRRAAPDNRPPAVIEHLEPAVRALEERLITAALAEARGDTFKASELLGLRSEGALLFILRRHPQLTERGRP